VPVHISGGRVEESEAGLPYDALCRAGDETFRAVRPVKDDFA